MVKTELSLKSSVLWDVTPCNPLKDVASIFKVEAKQETSVKQVAC
jgi:hypothetical protein